MYSLRSGSNEADDASTRGNVSNGGGFDMVTYSRNFQAHVQRYKESLLYNAGNINVAQRSFSSHNSPKAGNVVSSSEGHLIDHTQPLKFYLDTAIHFNRRLMCKLLTYCQCAGPGPSAFRPMSNLPSQPATQSRTTQMPPSRFGNKLGMEA